MSAREREGSTLPLWKGASLSLADEDGLQLRNTG